MSRNLQHLSPVETRIYQIYIQRSGKLAADNWLNNYLAKKPKSIVSSNHSNPLPPVFHSALARKGYAQRALGKLLECSKNRDIAGQEAIALAEQIIGSVWKEKLGNAYPLVLALVKGALEDGKRPDERDANDHHALSNEPTLGIISASVINRPTAFNERTIRRWLDPTAPHATAIRCWLGWRIWKTDTLLSYNQVIDPSTGEVLLNKGQSLGARTGGTLFRVRLNPLESVSPKQLSGCTKKRPSVFHPLKIEFEREWRDLEADRHEGYTWCYRHRTIYLEDINVQIKDKKTKDDIKSKKYGCFYKTNKTNLESSTHLLQQNYIYLDITSFEGALKLRQDVEMTAKWLITRVEGTTIEDEKRSKLMDRYRHAVWAAYKAHRYGETREGFELLTMLSRLANKARKAEQERIYKGKKPQIKDVAAFAWSIIEKRGFAEIRRDYGAFQKGRFLRVFGTKIAEMLGIMA